MVRSELPTLKLPDGTVLPRLGLGTWGMGEHRDRRMAEADALREGLDLGMTVIDTAEMYADGGAEEVVAAAIRGRRDGAFIVSKFYPHHASRRELARACEGSLGRLGLERIDLYLLHWRGEVPLAETVESLERLRSAGKIARWGVSNLDIGDLEAVVSCRGGHAVATNQVLYNLSRRGIEWDLLPWQREHRIPVMAYSPIEQGRLLAHPALKRTAAQLGATPAQVALAWAMREPDVMAIPKASSREHVRENRASADVSLDARTRSALDRAFAPPRRRTPLQMI
jgi:diketogulonate reductase-like aldo/keto reductase